MNQPANEARGWVQEPVPNRDLVRRVSQTGNERPLDASGRAHIRPLVRSMNQLPPAPAASNNQCSFFMSGTLTERVTLTP